VWNDNQMREERRKSVLSSDADLPLEEVNKAMVALGKGEVARSVVVME
jgi:Zn-dependent alcohol dehydrogenase